MSHKSETVTGELTCEVWEPRVAREAPGGHRRGCSAPWWPRGEMPRGAEPDGTGCRTHTATPKLMHHKKDSLVAPCPSDDSSRDHPAIIKYRNLSEALRLSAS